MTYGEQLRDSLYTNETMGHYYDVNGDVALPAVEAIKKANTLQKLK